MEIYETYRMQNLLNVLKLKEMWMEGSLSRNNSYKIKERIGTLAALIL